MKNYNKTGVSASRKDWGEWGSAIFITTVTITIISMIMQNSYRRGFGIGIISQVPTKSFPDGCLQALRVDVSGECFASKLALSNFVSKLSIKEKND